MNDTPATATVPAIRSKWLAAVTVGTGILSGIVGLGIGAVGLGFANATACGSGVGLAWVGLWMLFACRGVLQQRAATYIGLSLAWGWLIGRIVLDFPAVGSAAVLFLFLLPAISLPIGLAWVVLACVFCLGLARHLRRILLREGFGGWGLARVLRTGVLLGILVGLTLAMPRLCWHWRGQQIQTLAQKYSIAPPRRTFPASFGACSMAFLGYSLPPSVDPDASAATKGQKKLARALGDAEAELASAKAAGARYFRVGASGDQLLVSKPGQEATDDRYMTAIQRSGLGTVLVDTQHPDVCKRRKLSWAEFCQFQHDRIAYYQKRYRPDVYFVVCEPMSYHGFVLTPQSRYSAEDWATQLATMCRLVKSLQPSTRTGICLLVSPDREPEWEVWSRLRSLPELDILSVEIYEPDHFGQTEERLRRYGHPRDSGKQFWIAETFNGWALNGARRWDQDAAWLRVTADYARVVDAEAVLVWTFGTFVPGGSFWGFGNGQLERKWADGHRLSAVGETFRSLSSTAAAGTSSPDRP